MDIVTQFKNTSYFTSLKIGNRHKTWGGALKTVDLDLLEYDSDGEPMVLVEYKHAFQTYKGFDMDDLQLISLQKLGKRADLPVMLVVYWLNDDEQLKTWQRRPPLAPRLTDIQRQYQSKSPKPINRDQVTKYLEVAANHRPLVHPNLVNQCIADHGGGSVVYSQFYVIPLWDPKEQIGKAGWRTELEYVSLLYRLRGLELPKPLASVLCAELDLHLPSPDIR